MTGRSALRPFQQLRYEDVPAMPRVPHPYFECESRIVEIESRPFGRVRVRVKVHGSGPPLLLVHGFMTTSYSWRYVIAALGERYQVFAPDLVGAGESDKPDVSYAPRALSESIGATMRTLGIRGAAVIGNSLGGYLAMQLAMQDAGAMSRLVCLHAPGLPTARMRALRIALSLLPARPIVDALVRRDPLRWVHKNVHYFDESLKSQQEHEEYARPLRAAEGRRAFIRMLDETLDVRAMATFERQLRALGGKFPIPLQLVYAARDPMVPPAVGDRLRELLPSAAFARIQRGSHFAHVDAPEEFLAAAMPFLRA